MRAAANGFSSLVFLRKCPYISSSTNLQRSPIFSGIAVYQESGMARVSSVHGNRGEQRERDSAWSVGPELWTGLLDCWWDYRGSTRLIWPVTWTTIALRGIFSDESTCFTA